LLHIVAYTPTTPSSTANQISLGTLQHVPFKGEVNANWGEVLKLLIVSGEAASYILGGQLVQKNAEIPLTEERSISVKEFSPLWLYEKQWQRAIHRVLYEWVHIPLVGYKSYLSPRACYKVLHIVYAKSEGILEPLISCLGRMARGALPL
jgi:hypothetical protein